MKKIKLFGIANSRSYHRYIFERNFRFVDIMKDLIKIFDITETPEQEADRMKVVECKDASYSYESNKIKTDIFSGDSRIFLILIGNFNYIKKFNKQLETISYM